MPFYADPPEEIRVSPSVVIVNEGEIPNKVICIVKAFPDVTYTWEHGNQTINIGPELTFNYPIDKSQSGDYICVASNVHGNIAAVAEIHVTTPRVQGTHTSARNTH